MTPINKFFNSVTAAGADCTVTTDGMVTLKGLPAFKNTSPLKWTVTSYAADVAQIFTIAPTAASSTSYKMKITYTDTRTNTENTAYWTYTSDSSATATEISTNAIAFVNAIPNCPITAAASGTDFTLTADTYYPVFFVDVTGSTGTLTKTDSQTGVQGFGAGTNLDYFYPNLVNDGLITTNNYSKVSFIIPSQAFNDTVNGTVNQQYDVYVNVGDTDYPSLIAYNSTLKMGFGTLTAALVNNRLATISSVGANVAIASLVATRASGSFFTENIKGGDGLIIGATTALINVPYTDGSTAANLAFDKATVTGSDVSAAAALLVKFTNLPS